MKTTLGVILDAEQSLGEVMQERVPVAHAYKLGKLLKEIKSHLKPFYDTRQKMFKEYGEEKEGKITVKPENMEKFQNEMKELISVEIELQYQPLDLEKLGDIKISSVAMANLEDFFIVKPSE